MSRGSFVFRWRNEIFAGVSGGLLLALSFPPFPTRLLSVVALVPLLRYFIVCFPDISWRKGALKRGFWAGFMFGAAFFTVLLFWIANLIPESSINMSWVMFPAIVLLVVYLSCFPGLFGLAIAWLVRRFGTRAIYAAPALWALTEFLRSIGELGFSWGIISSSLVTYPIAIQGLAVYGPFGFSMILVLVNVFVAFIFYGRSDRARVWALSLLVLLVGVHLIYGNLRITGLDRDLEKIESVTNVAVVQPNVDLAIKWRPEYRDSVLTQIDELTRKAAAMGADVVIFPETAAPVSVSHSSKYRNWLKRIAKSSQVDLFIGYINHIQEEGRWRSFNACGLYDSEGNLVSQYHKINLLPFGERIPFSQYLPILEKLDFGQANFKRGEEMTIFDSKAGKFGTLICFESTFSEYTRRYIKKGAQLLVNITNDGWFGSKRGPLQHAETAILRAVENGVTLLRSANTGVSMHVDPAGRVKSSIGLDEDGILLVPVKILRKLTLYCRFGQLSFALMFLGNMLIFILPAMFQKH